MHPQYRAALAYKYDIPISVTQRELFIRVWADFAQKNRRWVTVAMEAAYTRHVRDGKADEAMQNLICQQIRRGEQIVFAVPKEGYTFETPVGSFTIGRDLVCSAAKIAGLDSRRDLGIEPQNTTTPEHQEAARTAKDIRGTARTAKATRTAQKSKETETTQATKDLSPSNASAAHAPKNVAGASKVQAGPSRYRAIVSDADLMDVDYLEQVRQQVGQAPVESLQYEDFIPSADNKGKGRARDTRQDSTAQPMQPSQPAESMSRSRESAPSPQSISQSPWRESAPSPQLMSRSRESAPHPQLDRSPSDDTPQSPILDQSESEEIPQSPILFIEEESSSPLATGKRSQQHASKQSRAAGEAHPNSSDRSQPVEVVPRQSVDPSKTVEDALDPHAPDHPVHGELNLVLALGADAPVFFPPQSTGSFSSGGITSSNESTYRHVRRWQLDSVLSTSQETLTRSVQRPQLLETHRDAVGWFDSQSSMLDRSLADHSAGKLLDNTGLATPDREPPHPAVKVDLFPDIFSTTGAGDSVTAVGDDDVEMSDFRSETPASTARQTPGPSQRYQEQSPAGTSTLGRPVRSGSWAGVSPAGRLTYQSSVQGGSVNDASSVNSDRPRRTPRSIFPAAYRTEARHALILPEKPPALGLRASSPLSSMLEALEIDITAGNAGTPPPVQKPDANTLECSMSDASSGMPRMDSPQRGLADLDSTIFRSQWERYCDNFKADHSAAVPSRESPLSEGLTLLPLNLPDVAGAAPSSLSSRTLPPLNLPYVASTTPSTLPLRTLQDQPGQRLPPLHKALLSSKLCGERHKCSHAQRPQLADVENKKETSKRYSSLFASGSVPTDPLSHFDF